jgi:hypothetical protein
MVHEASAQCFRESKGVAAAAAAAAWAFSLEVRFRQSFFHSSWQGKVGHCRTSSVATQVTLSMLEFYSIRATSDTRALHQLNAINMQRQSALDKAEPSFFKSTK